MNEERVTGALWQKSSKKGNEYFTGKIIIDGKITEIVLFYISKRKERSPWFKIVESHYEYGNTSDSQQRDSPQVAKGNTDEFRNTTWKGL